MTTQLRLTDTAAEIERELVALSARHLRTRDETVAEYYRELHARWLAAREPALTPLEAS